MAFRISLSIVVLIYTLLLGYHTAAQEHPDFGKNQTKLTAVRLIDPINPSIEMGYERAYNEWSTYAGVGFMRELLNLGDFHNYKGFRISAEQKYFFSSKETKLFGLPQYERLYLGIEAAHMNVKFDNADYLTTSSGVIYWEDFTVYKKTYSCNFKIGAQLLISAFVMEFYLGMGVKHKDVYHTGLTNNSALFDFKITNADGKYNTINLPAGFRIGYAF